MTTGWWLDIDITGNSNIVHIDDNNDYVIRNFNCDLDIDGDSNDVYVKQGQMLPQSSFAMFMCW